MVNAQAGILAPVPASARYLWFSAAPHAALQPALCALARLADGERVVVGLGASLVRALGEEIAGLRAFAGVSGPGVDVPATPASIWCWLRGEDRGDLLHRGHAIEAALGSAFVLERTVDAFRYDRGLDLSGYEDGTENPTGEAASRAALVSSPVTGLDASSFVAVQQWVHDFGRFQAMSPHQQDDAVGRRRSDNVELADAPPSAHVKRTAQESFEPPAFMLRRSMPWTEGPGAGLMFVAFGASFAAFEAQLARMVGAEDGITDAIFDFTRPITGAYFWCPPMRDGQLDLRVLGL